MILVSAKISYFFLRSSFFVSITIIIISQIITIFPDESDEDYYMAQVESKFGFIPQSYIELL